ncbi:glycosyltransferase family 39 protein [Crocosphaera chwakensis]|uniref:Glycosyltransferase RgtA/B/C/D-like domain-containing protein n=1 Tax=Crocosphaera chwakensis CCY0110 TaxID=391612 RepID=A3IVF9_9CHRO|nr:glycosyltransferase family 39 protein [Crocosphaera chwakensis]EAZ89531.1 hypothetical protein CY0110_09181 [Crocosphaera chwakensis CCY0110]
MTTNLSKKLFKTIIIFIIILGIIVRLTNLDNRVYWKDEVFTSLRVSGYTEEEVIKNLYDGSVLSSEDLQKYQQTRFFNNPIGTVYGLAKEEAQLPPLYFLLVKLWVSLFGNSVTITRSLSAIFSIISCFVLYLFCKELFESNMVAWLSMALLAVSPFYVVYSQEARPYSLWLLTSLLSNWMLLRSLRLNNKWNWRMYALTIVLGLYTSPFSLFLNLGQGVYVFLREKSKFNQIVKKYLMSLIIGILGFSPWLAIIVIRYHQIKGRTSWSSNNYENGLIELIFNWLRNITRTFVDFELLNAPFSYLSQHPFIYLIAVIPVSFLVGYSVYFLCKNSSKSTWLFILLWIASTAFPLILADIILGGRRSGTARYLLPSYLGLQISVAYCLATGLKNTISAWKQKLLQIMTICICFVGLVSSFYASSQAFWWNNDPSRYYQNPEILPIINKTSNSLVISDEKWDQIMTLSYSLSPDIQYQLVKQYNQKELPDNFKNYFLYKPSKNLKEQFEEKKNYQVQAAYESNDPWLWVIERK